MCGDKHNNVACDCCWSDALLTSLLLQLGMILSSELELTTTMAGIQHVCIYKKTLGDNPVSSNRFKEATVIYQNSASARAAEWVAPGGRMSMRP